MKPSSVTRVLTIIFLKVFSNLWVKMLLAICKSRHSPLPKQAGKIGDVLGLTFAARVFTTTSDPHEPIIERGNKQTRCWVGNACDPFASRWAERRSFAALRMTKPLAVTPSLFSGQALSAACGSGETDGDPSLRS